MFLRFCDRPSDSPYIERVWRGRSDGGGPFVSVAAGHLELVVTRLADLTMVTMRGPETRATTIDCPPDGEWAAIRFRLGVHMPALPTHLLVDHRDVDLPVAADGSFALLGSRWPLPDLENAERYVEGLARRGVIARDDVVEAAMRGDRQRLTSRSVQRHFRRTTGMTHGQFRQIERPATRPTCCAMARPSWTPCTRPVTSTRPISPGHSSSSSARRRRAS